MTTTTERRISARCAALTLIVSLGFVDMPGACAEPRALLIGVGEYPVLAQGAASDPRLPGIDIDIANMRRVARIMGFEPSQVSVLFNGDATHERVVRELSTWARDGVRPEDPVLIYFSGHGTRIPDSNGDEPDGLDEVLVMNDTARVRTGKSVTLEKVLVDDQLGELLAKIPSRHILVLVDACHSGTATRELDIEDRRLGESRAFPKFYYYEGMSAEDDAGTIAAKGDDGSHVNYVSLSAARDTQSAVATYKGGLFTLGLIDAVKRAAAAKRNPRLTEVRDEVDAFISRSIEPAQRHNPEVTGDSKLAEGGIALVPIENGNGPVWAELQGLVAQGKPLKVTASRDSYRVGENLEIAVEVPSDGFLNIVSVDSMDQATVLYPNQYDGDSAVKKGVVYVPSREMKFVLPAQEPLGPTLVVALLTRQLVNLRDYGIEGRDASGKLTQAFTDLSSAGTRAFGIAAREKSFNAGQVTVNTVAAGNP